jgi:hypothetical protein
MKTYDTFRKITSLHKTIIFLLSFCFLLCIYKIYEADFWSEKMQWVKYLCFDCIVLAVATFCSTGVEKIRAMLAVLIFLVLVILLHL